MKSKIIAITISIIFLLNSTLYSCPFLVDSIRMPVGGEVYKRMKQLDNQHQTDIDVIISSLIMQAQGVSVLQELNNELSAAINQSGLQAMYSLCNDVLNRAGGKIQVIFVDSEDKLPLFNGKRVWGHAGKYITVFALKSEFESEQGRRKIIARIFHEIRARSTRAKQLFDEKTPYTVERLQELQEQFEKTNMQAMDEIERYGYIKDEILKQEFARLIFDLKVSLENRDYAFLTIGPIGRLITVLVTAGFVELLPVSGDISGLTALNQAVVNAAAQSASAVNETNANVTANVDIYDTTNQGSVAQISGQGEAISQQAASPSSTFTQGNIAVVINKNRLYVYNRQTGRLMGSYNSATSLSGAREQWIEQYYEDQYVLWIANRTVGYAKVLSSISLYINSDGTIDFYERQNVFSGYNNLTNAGKMGTDMYALTAVVGFTDSSRANSWIQLVNLAYGEAIDELFLIGSGPISALRSTKASNGTNYVISAIQEGANTKIRIDYQYQERSNHLFFKQEESWQNIVINDIVYSKDGNTAYVFGIDKSTNKGIIRVGNVADNTTVWRDLMTFDTAVKDIAVTADNTLYALTQDNKITVWDISGATPVKKGDVNGLPVGKVLTKVSVRSDGVVEAMDEAGVYYLIIENKGQYKAYLPLGFGQGGQQAAGADKAGTASSAMQPMFIANLNARISPEIYKRYNEKDAQGFLVRASNFMGQFLKIAGDSIEEKGVHILFNFITDKAVVLEDSAIIIDPEVFLSIGETDPTINWDDFIHQLQAVMKTLGIDIDMNRLNPDILTISAPQEGSRISL